MSYYGIVRPLYCPDIQVIPILYFYLFSSYLVPSVLGIVTRLRDGRSGVQFLAGARNFSLLKNVKICCGAHPASYSMGTRNCFTGIKQLGHEADHSPPSSAEVQNICFRGM
jgi:hypothetical protein